MNRTIRTFAKVEFGYVHKAEAYTEDGKVFRWASNNAVCPVDACQEYAIPADLAAQAAARDAELTAFAAAYRAARRGRRPSAEERYELRAAFGPGQTVVNVLTGERTRT